MKKTPVSRLGSGIAVTAIATLAALGTAHAERATTNAELGISGTNFAELKATGGAQFDSSRYDQVNLGPLSSTLWAPKRGAQGPMASEANNQHEMQMRELERQLGPIGGRNTF